MGKGTNVEGGSGGGSLRKDIPPVSGQVTLRADFYAGPEIDFPLYQGAVYCRSTNATLVAIYTCSASTFVEPVQPPAPEPRVPRAGNWAFSPVFYDAAGLELRDARNCPGYRFDGVAGFDDLPRETWWRMGVSFDTTTGRITQYTSKNLITGEAWTMGNPQAWHDYGAGPVLVDVYVSGGAGVKNPASTVGFYNVGNGQLSLFDNITISNEELPPETTTPSPVTAPMWVYGWPMADAITNSGVTARAKINEVGAAYYIVLADGAPAPTSAGVKAGTGAIKRGVIALTANTENTANVTGLAPESFFDVWFVAEDSDSNLQACPRKVDVTTTAGPPVPLTGAILEVR